MLLTNFRQNSDWFYLITAVLVIDLIVLFLTKYAGEHPTFKVNSLNEWYTRFGSTAVASDVLSILIGIMATRYIYTSLNLKNPFLFLVILILFQLCHDIFFYTQVIQKLPDGYNEMIDVFKAYGKENGAYILLADATMMVSSVLLASFLKVSEDHFVTATLMITLYSLTYIIYTKG